VTDAEPMPCFGRIDVRRVEGEDRARRPDANRFDVREAGDDGVSDADAKV
jgi:hypothetical protein